MKCYIYKCSRKPDMYIYLAEEDNFSKIPKDIYNSLGITELAMTLELDADRKMAKEDPLEIMGNLTNNGFHLQLPAETSIEEIMTQLARQK